MAKAMTFLKDVGFPTHGYFETKNADSLILSDNSKCNNSCKLDIISLPDSSTLFLKSVTLTFENYNHSIIRQYSSNVYFYFDCSSWSNDHLGIFWTSYCKNTNADCFKIAMFCVCRCNSGYLMINGHCVQGNITVGKACVSSLQCTGSQYSQHCAGGVCVCQKGYIPFNNSCLQVNLTLTQSCVVNDQCSGSPYVSCLEEKCSCIKGYIALNSTDCVLGNLQLTQSCVVNDQCSGSPYASCLEEKCSCIEGYTALNSMDCVLESTNNSMGLMIGALFGGLLIGVIITSSIAYLMYRRSHFSIDKRKEPGVRYAVNETFDDVRDEDIFQNEATTKIKKEKQMKFLNVSPITRSQELPEYSNASEKEPAMTTTDDVYNHLNEKGETQDEDTYDHACAAAGRSHLRDLDDYSNIHAMDDDTVVSGRTENDDYSTLEHN